MGLAPGVVDRMFAPGGLFDTIATKTVLDERGTNLYFVILSLVGTKNFGGENLFSVARDYPHIGRTAGR